MLLSIMQDFIILQNFAVTSSMLTFKEAAIVVFNQIVTLSLNPVLLSKKNTHPPYLLIVPQRCWLVWTTVVQSHDITSCHVFLDFLNNNRVIQRHHLIKIQFVQVFELWPNIYNNDFPIILSFTLWLTW